MTKLTIVRFAIFTLVVAIGTFWWGVHLGREHVSRETFGDHQGRVNAPIRLLGDSDNEAKDANSPSKTSHVRQANPEANKRTVEEVIAEAMELASGGLVSPRRMAMTSDLINEVKDKDLTEALDLIEREKRGDSKRFVRMILLSRWAEFDSPGAATYVLENPGEHPQGAGWGHTGMLELSEVISHWVERDPSAAFEWYESNSDQLSEMAFDPNDGTCLRTIFNALSLQDMDEAFVKLKSIKSDRSRMFAMTGMMRGSDTQQRSVLMERLGAIEDPQIREEGYLTLITQWGHFDPREAAVFLDNATDLDPKVEEMLTTVVGDVWMANHPEEGANWLIDNATDEHRSARMVNAVRSWVRQDPNGAAKWLGQFEPSLEMDDAVSTFAISTMHLDMKASFDWSTKITDENKRHRTIQLVFQQWHVRNAEQAEAHLQASDVPPERSTEWIEQAASRTISRPPRAVGP